MSKEIKISEQSNYLEGKYPYLAKSIYSDTIVLFTKKNTGFCLYSSGKYYDGTTTYNKFGDFLDNYTESSFEPYDGKINLSN